MKRYFLLMPLLMLQMIIDAQEKFGIATFTPPAGWQRTEQNGSLSFYHSKTENGSTSFCQIILYPGSNSNGKADKDFKTAWNNLVTVPTQSKAKPLTQTDKTPDGWTVITGSANINYQGLNYKTILAVISGFGRSMPVQINTAGGDYSAVLDKFFNELDLDSNTTIQNNPTNMNATISLKDYDFASPEKWALQNNNDHIAITNPQSGCVIRILSPQPSSGNLEQDVNSVFDLMYKGWSYQQSGDKQFIMAKGILPKGLEYYRKEATMTGYTADGRYQIEEGSAAVVKTGNKIVIISIRHNSSSLGHDDCYKNYNTLARFFNSFSVTNAPVAKSNEEDAAKRIIGLWKIVSTGVVTGDYVFAANGNYQYGGAVGYSTSTSDDRYEYIYNRAYPFHGDGSYMISENKLTLTKRSGSPETTTIRFEKIRYGTTAWKDRIYILKKDALTEYESIYEKEIQ